MMMQHPPPQQAPPSGLSRTAKLLLGGIGMLVGLPCTLTMVVDLFRGTDNIMGVLIVGLTSAMILLFGVMLFRSGLRASAPVSVAPMAWMTQEMEREILRAAERRGGMLTVAQLALETPLSVSQCNAALMQLEHQGAVRSDVGLDGALCYHFLGLGGGGEQVVFDMSERETRAAQQPATRGEDGRW